MQANLIERDFKQADFLKRQEKSSAFALRLKRFGYEMKAMLNGDDKTPTGRMLTMVKKRFSATFAFLAGSDSLPIRLMLAQSFNNTLNLQIIAEQAKNLWNQISTIKASPTAEVVHSEFSKVAAPVQVVQQLIDDQISFEQKVANIKAEHDASGLIGPSAELFSAFENSSKTHALKVSSFNDFGKPVEYAHCANKVDALTIEFSNNVFRNTLHNIFGTNAEVQVYGNVLQQQEITSFIPPIHAETRELCPVTPYA